ncbi:conserved hypothetical protein [Bosea sp. 62]|uniref:hypothetical protein n=1 Tax=unclassified Bosea (in: a-proteobacteria) TaxID=2653178 RepID=UPI0012546FAA|nr:MULTISPECIES: hypothetical protein [unclassified Bosea (in: a-proteobacteria)]CAD5287062.1 conserved hypothetical protein [Bosea sp. 21B]CAD5289465.1 conserved hypothetical protein [Bosea sp. 46]CAD5301148.1 conserved hypothetical protein [Bosea sp. 7B]VVT60502.1 conserved hypothetical protein [Bosea sp. EC-HK365B]VXB02696.1 conserved hypothetical protein [Bosea sp. 62]
MNDRTDGASIVDGRMTLPGAAGAFVQDVARPLAFAADGLVAISGHEWRDGVLHDAARIEGHVRPDGATLARIDQAGPAQDLSLTIRSFPGDSAPLLRLSFPVGAQGDLDARLAAELFLPQPLFAGLRQDLAEGRASSLSLTATTNLWLREGAGDEEPPVFHFAPETDGRPAQAHGRVQSISWRPAEPTAEGFLAPGQSDQDSEEPEDLVAEQLRRINWSLKQVLIILVFLMLIVALK